MPKILLVEDDPFITEIYQKKLITSGFEVDNVVTGREVLKRVMEKKYDLILLDLVLPEMSGMEVLRELKGKSGVYAADLKIVIFSNLSSPDDREQAIHAGADGFISKTEFTPTEVVTEVQRYLKQFSEQIKHAERRGEGNGGVEQAVPVVLPQEGKKKILLIEDEDVFVEMFGKRLTDDGYSVIAEQNGKTALDRALKEKFDLIIMDVMLPEIEGRQVIQELKNNEQTKTTPIFLLSASISVAEMETMESDKVVDRAFLKTKITPTELTEAVNEFFHA